MKTFTGSGLGPIIVSPKALYAKCFKDQGASFQMIKKSKKSSHSNNSSSNGSNSNNSKHDAAHAIPLKLIFPKIQSPFPEALEKIMFPEARRPACRKWT